MSHNVVRNSAVDRFLMKLRPNLTPLGTSLAKHLSVIAPDHCVSTVIRITSNFETLLTAL